MPRYGCYSQAPIAIQLDRYQKDLGLSERLTQGRQAGFLCLYMTKLVLCFLVSKTSSASINHIANTWVLRATEETLDKKAGQRLAMKM
jgi:hypothetical protein